jgi:hypothetical protein
MISNIIMILTCFAVAGALTFVLMQFFKKLNKLEHERWGDKAKVDTEGSLGTNLKRMFRGSKKKAKVAAPAPKQDATKK